MTDEQPARWHLAQLNVSRIVARRAPEVAELMAALVPISAILGPYWASTGASRPTRATPPTSTPSMAEAVAV